MSTYAIDIEPRCKACGKLLAMTVTRPWTIGCGRCKTSNTGDSFGHPRNTRTIDSGDD